MQKAKGNLKGRASHRAKILEGQVRALAAAIEREEHCPDILLQSLSIQKSLQSLNQLLLENHLRNRVVKQLTAETEGEKAILELLRIFSIR